MEIFFREKKSIKVIKIDVIDVGALEPKEELFFLPFFCLKFNKVSVT